MTFTRDVKIGDLNIDVYITQIPCVKNEETCVFGYPLGVKELNKTTSIEDFGNTTSGTWLRLDFKKEELVVTTDVLGGFRVYYFKEKSKLIISDDFDFILKRVKQKLTRNNIEYDYWIKHRFTTGGTTFIKGLNKVSPASSLIITEKNTFENTYFKNINRETNAIMHQEKVHKDLLNTFSKIDKSDQHKILLFSGGKDSCLLLQYMLQYKKPFTLVFFKIKPFSKFAIDDLKKIRAISKELGVSVDEIEININNVSKEVLDLIVNKQVLDKHYSLLHYVGIKKLKEKYGNNILVINGQSSDSILSFGPSENSLMSYFRRNIMYCPNSLISKLGNVLLRIKTRKQYVLPRTNQEKLIALFDEYKYTRVLEKSKNKEYYKYIFHYIKDKTQKLNSYYSKEMYVKILSFCQGSDNQVVVNSGKHWGINVVMPFATPEIIYNTVRFKDEQLEINKPKYIIEGILTTEFSFNYKKLKLKEEKINPVISERSKITDEELNSLFLKKSISFFE